MGPYPDILKVSPKPQLHTGVTTAPAVASGPSPKPSPHPSK